MANTNIKDSIYEAIDVIVGKRIEDLHLDKTIKCNIIACLDSATKKYKISYAGGETIAYAQSESVYFPNTEVYVTIPQGNFSNKKWIIGRTSEISSSIEQDISDSTLSQYSVLGNNVVSLATDQKVFTITSAAPNDNISDFQHTKILYNSNNNINNYLNIDVNAIEVYKHRAQGLLVGANFSTNLIASQPNKRNNSGDYGIIINIATKNSGEKYMNMTEKWKALAPKTQYLIVKNQDLWYSIWTKFVKDDSISLENFTINLAEYQSEDSPYNTIQDDLNNLYLPALRQFYSEIQVDAAVNELMQQYMLLLQSLLYKTSWDEISSEYNDWWISTENIGGENIVSYILNTSKMTGDYFNFRNSYQYFVANINMENFVRIENIIFYSDGWAQNSDIVDDIQVQNINISFLQEAEGINGNYKLEIETPQGIIFNTNSQATDQLTINAKLTYDKEDITSFSNILWFKKNNNITVESEKYSTFAGAGWERLTTSSNDTLVTKCSQNINYENIYKVVGTQNLDDITSLEFVIYNQKNLYEVNLISNAGTAYGDGDSEKILTCIVNNQTELNTEYSYTWYRIINGEMVKLTENNRLMQDILKEKQAALHPDESSEDFLQNQILQQQIQDLEGIQYYNENTWNQIKVGSQQISSENSQVLIECRVTQADNTATVIGTGSITLAGSINIILQNNTIEIINGNQVFQYSEFGVSPASERCLDPITPRVLSCNFYNVNGGLINPDSYEVFWEYPINDTLIDTSILALEENTNKQIKNIWRHKTAPLAIKEKYNYNYTNNQIICNILYKDGVYSKETNLFFGKMGDVGTNGTDVVAKITPIQNISLSNSQDLTVNLLAMIAHKVPQTSNGQEIQYKYNAEWNNGLSINSNILDFKLYRRNNLINPSEYKNVKWIVANNGGMNKIFNIKSKTDNGEHKAQIYLRDNPEKISANSYTNQIIKCQADLIVDNKTTQTYYGYYPIPLIIYEHNPVWSVGIDKETTLRQVVYNSDGRNPQYNENQGIGLRFYNLGENKLRLTWTPRGGIANEADATEKYPAFALGYNDIMTVCSQTTIDDENAQIQQDIEELQQTYFGDDNNLGLLYFIKGDDSQSYQYELSILKGNSDKGIQHQINEKESQIISLTQNINMTYDNWKSIIKEYLDTIHTQIINTALREDLGASFSQGMAENFVNTVKENNFYDLTNLQILLSSGTAEIQSEAKDVFTQLMIYVGQIIQQNQQNAQYNQDIQILTQEIVNLQEAQTNIDKLLTAITHATLDTKDQCINFLQEYYSSYLTIIYNERLEEYNKQLENYNNQLEINHYYSSNDIIFNSIIPNDSYNGQYVNQHVKIEIYENDIKEATILIPIHMLLNVYGLASINAWDGNSIQLNEAEGYILAPQVGAGVKHNEDNTFTGIVIGTEQISQEEETNVGLLGYSHGRRSIFLDAATGEATFGLAEDESSNPLTEGRIELRPGGISSIANWKIDARSLYRIVTPEETAAFIKYKYKKAETYGNNQKTLGPPYADAPQYATGSIPHDSQGILLSGLPAYISAKGRVLTKADHPKKIDFLDPGTTVKPNDTFELQIDPNDGRFFELYEHSAGRPEIDYSYFYIDDSDEHNVYIYQQYIVDSEVNTRLLTHLSNNKWAQDTFVFKGKDSQGDDIDSGEYVVAHKINLTTGYTWVFYVINEWNENIILNDDLEDFTDNIKSFIDEHKVWRRYKKAGIDSRGRFTVEGINTGDSSFAVEEMDAFDGNLKYVGLNIRQGEVTEDIIGRLFYPINSGNTSPLYISSTSHIDGSGGNAGNEGMRPIRIYADAYSNTVNRAMSSGIFVGQSGKENPDYSKMSRLEFQIDNDQTSFSIDLSADYNSNRYSKLHLEATDSDNTGVAQGYLHHKGTWTTLTSDILRLESEYNTVQLIGNSNVNSVQIYNSNGNVELGTGSNIHIWLGHDEINYFTSIIGYGTHIMAGDWIYTHPTTEANYYGVSLRNSGENETGLHGGLRSPYIYIRGNTPIQVNPHGDGIFNVGLYVADYSIYQNQGSNYYTHPWEELSGTNNVSYNNGFTSSARSIGAHLNHCLGAAETAYNHLVPHNHTYDKTTSAELSSNEFGNVTITINGATYTKCTIQFNTTPAVNVHHTSTNTGRESIV